MNKFFLLSVIALGFLVLLLSGAATYYYNHKVSELTFQESELDAEADFFNSLLYSLVDTETGERGFIITGEEKYLDPYHNALLLLIEPSTRTFLVKTGETTPILKDLNHLILDKLADNQKKIELRRFQGFEAAQKVEAEGVGKEIMDKIRVIIKKIIQDKRGEIAKKTDNLKSSIEKINIIANVSNALVFVLMSSSLIAIYFYADREEKKQKQVLFLDKLRKMIMEHSRGIILTLDPRGSITTCNKNLIELTGYSDTDLIGKSFSKFIDPHDDEINLKKFSDKYSKQFSSFGEVLLHAKEQPIEGDVVWAFKPGQQRHFQASITSLIDPDGNFTGYLLEGNDISERIKLQEKLIKTNAEAENANRAKDQFLTSLSHDLRTPLTAIIGCTEILKETGENNLTEKQFQLLKWIQDNGQHLLTMVADIMSLEKFLARKEVVNVSAVNVSQLIEQIFHEFDAVANRKGLILIMEGAEGAESIQTDGDKIYRILSNLISNAVKFTPQGSVRVVVTQDTQTHQPVRVDVIDTGIGINPAHFDQIFQPFFQINRTSQNEGSGFGLSICLAYAQLLGYKLSFHSVLGQGSTFTLDLS